MKWQDRTVDANIGPLLSTPSPHTTHFDKIIFSSILAKVSSCDILQILCQYLKKTFTVVSHVVIEQNGSIY